MKSLISFETKVASWLIDFDEVEGQNDDQIFLILIFPFEREKAFVSEIPQSVACTGLF